nr:EOG090X07B6 [Sida crystallina]
MADSADTRVNLAALKRVDPYAVEIVETGTQVAIYKFNSESNEWEKTDIEGTLFLYARSGDPKHGFVVMNRLSTENLVEPITKDLEIQEQAPFLLYKNAKHTITGVWFYEESECKRIAEKLDSLVKRESNRRQLRENMNKRGKAVKQFLSHPPVGITDLFATESVGPVPMPLHHGGVVFERLLSGAASPGTPTFVPPPTLPTTELHTAQSLERELRGKLKTRERQEMNNNSSTPSGDKRLPHASPLRASGGANVKPGGLAAAMAHPQIADMQVTFGSNNAAGTPPRNVAIQPIQSVPLMSPMMFASAPTTQPPLSGAAVVLDHPPAYQEVVGPQTPVHRSSYVSSQEGCQQMDAENQVTPLTKAQLSQAFNYLLKNDPNFVTQLHDAYVQSLKKSLKVGP